MSVVYADSAHVLNQLENRRGSVKRVTYAEGVKNTRQVFALVTETLKFRSIITDLLDDVRFFQENKRMRKQRNLVVLMVHDLLFSKTGKIQGGGSLKKLVMRYRSSLSSALARLKIKRKAVDNEDLLPETHRNPFLLPRYARVNTLKTSLSEVLCTLSSEWDCSNEALNSSVSPSAGVDSPLPNGGSTFSRTASDGGSARRPLFMDPHVPHLLVFPPNTDLHDHPLVEEGKLVLQGKASCVPAYELAPPPGSVVIDACAAPGNKTTALAAIMKNIGTIFAIDRDPSRIELLKTNAERVGASIIRPICQSFLELDTTLPLFSKVTHVLVDPSCSGSGIVGRMDHLVDALFHRASGLGGTVAAEAEPGLQDGLDEERLVGLANFQLAALRHAFQLPHVQRIVYSTCSVHDIENEAVVAAALSSPEGHPFRLLPALPEWPSRGRTPREQRFLIPGSHNVGEGSGETPPFSHCVRMFPSDQTIGFFVALFERVPPGSGNAEGPEPTAADRPQRKRGRRKPNVAPVGVGRGSPWSNKREDQESLPSGPKKRRRRRRKKKVL